MPDARGHGLSDHPPRGYLLPDYARDLAGLIAALALVRPAIIGHSLGGLIALTWALERPEVASGIVLEDVPLLGGPSHAPALEGWQALAMLSPAEAAAYYRREHPEWTEEALAAGQFDRVAPLAALRSPMLLVHGDETTGGMVRAADATRFAALSPRFSAVRIPGGSHSLHRERTREFLEAVWAFLAHHR
jgi:N-formylmaleamate deformylase